MSNVPEIKSDRRGGTLTFNLAAVVWIVMTVFSVAGTYWSAKIGVEKANANLDKRVYELESYKGDVIQPTVAKVDTMGESLAALKQGMVILLNNQGFNGEQVLSRKQ